jgi:hypothetical protein
MLSQLFTLKFKLSLIYSVVFFLVWFYVLSTCPYIFISISLLSRMKCFCIIMYVIYLKLNQPIFLQEALPFFFVFFPFFIIFIRAYNVWVISTPFPLPPPFLLPPLSPLTSCYQGETILSLSLVLLKREYKQ